jgi:DNA-binding transcriptional MerR regulator
VAFAPWLCANPVSAPMKTLTILEVSKCSGVPTHTLRFWEKELAGIIVPERTKGGQRRYTQEHILIIDEIKSFKGKGMSLTEIKYEMNHRHDSVEQLHNHWRADMLADKVAEIVRSVIVNYLEGKVVKE